MKRDPRLNQVERLIDPFIDEEGLELVASELKLEPVGLVLRIYLDTKDGGIGVDDLAKASQSISKVLDNSGVITQKFTLEVSSPGIERPLTKPEHFKKYVGSKVLIKTDTAIGNRKQFKGVLMEAGDEDSAVEIDKERYTIAYDTVVKARLRVDIEF